jgi:hypothetical protein
MITIIRDIPTEALTEHKDYVNHLFRNSNGVYNICRNEEDVIKSNQWFSNLPKRVILVDEDQTIVTGDRFVARCCSQDLDGKIFKFTGRDSDDILDMEHENGDIVHTTEGILENSLKVIREANMEDLENVVNAKCAILEIK